MNDTWNLVSHESRKKIWVGQGTGSMSTFYSGEPETMGHLKRFLNDTKGENLELVSNMMGEKHYDYEDYATPKEELKEWECGGKVWLIPRIPHNSSVNYRGMIFSQHDATDDMVEFRSIMDGSLSVVMLN